MANHAVFDWDIAPEYLKVLAKRCATYKPSADAEGCTHGVYGVQLLPGAAYYVDPYRMLKVPTKYDGPAVFIAPETMKRVGVGNTLEVEETVVYLNAVKAQAWRAPRRDVQAVEAWFVREASVVVQADALRDAFNSLKRCKVVGMWAKDDAAILFSVDSRQRCVDARKVPAKVDGTPPPVYLQRRFLKDVLDLPGDEVRIDAQESDEASEREPALECVRIAIGDAVEYIATWGLREAWRSRQACVEAWEHAEEAE